MSETELQDAEMAVKAYENIRTVDIANVQQAQERLRDTNRKLRNARARLAKAREAAACAKEKSA